MSVYLKDTSAVLDYRLDWAAAYLDGDTIATTAWAVTPAEAEGLVIQAESLSGGATTVTVSGGIAGRVYRLTNRITTTGGRTDERTLLIRISDR